MGRPSTLLLFPTLFLSACGGAATGDGGIDAGGVDGRASDLGAHDTGAIDAGGSDTGPVDGGSADAPSACVGAAGDADGDGHRSISCGGDDCDDGDATRYPGNPETCDTAGHDDDCNPTTLGPDHDLDGFVSTSCCNRQESGTIVCGTDCDDTSMDISPAAPEICDGVDDNCNAIVDEGVLSNFFHDVDGDGIGDSTMTVARCSAPASYVLIGGDCDDTRATVHPGATEVCNGRDDDCDGTADPGCACTGTMTRPCGTGDGMGGLLMVGACHPGTQSCTSGVWDTCGGNVDPMAESCNGADDNCNGATDEGVQSTYYLDADGDGHGLTRMTVLACTVPAGYALLSGDCDDAISAVHPGAGEICNGRDDNCDGAVDEGVTTSFYRDADGDGYGVTSMMVAGCTAPLGYVTTLGDCDDVVASTHPGAGDACDGVDNDCDGAVDPTCMCTSGAMRACGTSDGMGGFLTRGLCHPGMQNCIAGSWGPCAGNVDPTTESCNTLDDDCDGVIDNGALLTCYPDNDEDGYAPAGSAVVSMGCTCLRFSTPRAPVGTNIDCDDTSGTVSPSAVEVCDGRDDDCSSGGAAVPAEDMDGDHHTASGYAGCSGGAYPKDDCDDSVAAVHPGQTSWFTTPYGPGTSPSFDYDCSGTATGEYTTVCPWNPCSGTSWPACLGTFCMGWIDVAPACGEYGTAAPGTCQYRMDLGGCVPNAGGMTQACH